jgi:positive regulator of sigma E activity
VVREKPGMIRSWTPVRVALVLFVYMAIVVFGSAWLVRHGQSNGLIMALSSMGGIVVGLWVVRELHR